MTAQTPPAWLGDAGVNHAADDVRRLFMTLFNDAEGVVATGHMAVSEKSGGANMSVDIAEGRCVVLGTEGTYQGAYFCQNQGVENLAIAAADATNDRIDLVVAQIRDSEYSGSDDDFRLFVVTGTAAASPSEPTVPANSYVLARVDVSSGVSSITDSDITDRSSVLNPGYQLVAFTSSGSFVKADYPWAKTARVRVIGGGGAGGGAATTSASEGSVGTGGGGGAYSESTIAVSSMSSSETVTVGAGGTGVAGGNGNDGSSSSFGTLVTANAGEGGDTIGPTTTTTIFANIADGGGTGGTGQIKVGGGDGKPGKWMDTYTGSARGGYGGGTAMASSQRPPNQNNSNGSAGQGYGAGGSGASNAVSQATARTGGAGAAGIVIVELFGG